MSARTRLLVDSVLLAAFVAAYYPFKTGLAVHEWLCVIIIIPTLAHLVVNWDWAQRVATRVLGSLRATTRLNFVVDAALYVAVVTAMVSGFVVSRVIGGVLGYDASPYPAWHLVHSLSADATIVLALVHLGLHWRWVVRVARTRVLAGLVYTVPGDDPTLLPVEAAPRDAWEYARRSYGPPGSGRSSAPARGASPTARTAAPTARVETERPYRRTRSHDA